MTAPASRVRFLVLLDAAPRALLFDGANRLIGEVIEDDGFIVDRLLTSATPCPLPEPVLATMVPPPSAQWPVRCYELS